MNLGFLWHHFWNFCRIIVFQFEKHGVVTSSVQFCCSVMSDYLQPHGLQHARLLCPSSSPSACSNSCPLSWWCFLTISYSVIPFSSCLWSFPASGSFQICQFFALGSQSIGVSANVEHFFMCLLATCISFLEKCQFRSSVKLAVIFWPSQH